MNKATTQSNFLLLPDLHSLLKWFQLSQFPCCVYYFQMTITVKNLQLHWLIGFVNSISNTAMLNQIEESLSCASHPLGTRHFNFLPRSKFEKCFQAWRRGGYLTLPSRPPPPLTSTASGRTLGGCPQIFLMWWVYKSWGTQKCLGSALIRPSHSLSLQTQLYQAFTGASGHPRGCLVPSWTYKGGG